MPYIACDLPGEAVQNRKAYQMWNNGQGWQAYGDLNLRTWYQSDLALRLRSATDLTENTPVVERGRNQRGVQFNPFKSTQHCSRTNLIQYTPVVERSRNQRGVLEFSAVSQNLKGRPVAPLSGDVTELGTTMTERLRRDFECLGIDYNAFYPGETRLQALEILQSAPEVNEYQVFFYHSDHLGSSSFITDANGDATQHLQYLPFGEDLVHEQNTAAYLSPYTFSGKERDVETSLSYFGARYYEAGLSVWLSVDPMSDERPMITPYNYCRLNPVLYVDPHGLLEELAPYLVFDGELNQLFIYDDSNTPDDFSDDVLIGAFDAHNNVASNSKGKWEDGTYPMLDKSSRHTHNGAKEADGKTLQDSKNGRYGDGGIYRAKDFTENSVGCKTRRGMAVHAGRENKDFLKRKTMGCIRTTPEAMDAIDDAISTYGALTTIIVVKNRQSGSSDHVASLGIGVPRRPSVGVFDQPKYITESVSTYVRPQSR